VPLFAPQGAFDDSDEDDEDEVGPGRVVSVASSWQHSCAGYAARHV
jgi:hypothetical protein